MCLNARNFWYTIGFPANDMREVIRYSDRIHNLAAVFDWRVESRTNGHNFGDPEVTVSYRERAKIAPCLSTSSFGAIDIRRKGPTLQNDLN